MLPQPRHAEQGLVTHADAVGLLATRDQLPFVESGNQAVAIAIRIAKSGLVGGRVATGVDQLRADVRVFRPPAETYI